MYSIDQGPQPAPIGTITLQGSAVRMTIPGRGGTYEGKLSADGNMITGTWQGTMPPIEERPFVGTLNLTRATPETAWAIPVAPPPNWMAADADPVFEVATIKPSRPGERGGGFNVTGRQFSATNQSVSDLLSFSYGIHVRQISGGPAWLETEKFDLLAEPDGEGAPSAKQWISMLQKLLADRFKLTFHREKQELSVYAITIAKTGPKLTRSLDDPNGGYGNNFSRLGNAVAVNSHNETIVQFANWLQLIVLDQPVVDQTGLLGRYDHTLTWTPDETQFGGQGARVSPPPVDNPGAPPDLFTAIQEQLGLKLESTKAPVDVLVIDHVEEPTPN
jgi:uncharacterized protein (TIGR03435 family)